MSSHQKAVIVTGANGWIGRALCSHLKATGCMVVAADLSEEQGDWDEFLALDLQEDSIFNRDRLKAVLAKSSEWSLVHCAGYAHRPVETPEEVERFYAINHAGTEKVVACCHEFSIQRLVYISSIAFYDWSIVKATELFDEAAPVRGATAYADSKLKGEQCILQSSLDYRVVRLATVFGKGDHANFLKLAIALKSKKFVIPGNGNAAKSVISVNKAAECIGRLAVINDPKYRLLNLGFPSPVTVSQICEQFSESCGFAPPRGLPLWVLRILASVGDSLTKCMPAFPLTSDNLRKLSNSTVVNCTRASEMFPELNHTCFARELHEARSWYIDNVDG